MGLVISWHILLPAFTVGLASYIAVLEHATTWAFNKNRSEKSRGLCGPGHRRGFLFA
jgi:hypothetical protein